ncbi:hypothetical protein [Methylococcus sp. EFPC2]|uniref:hypothetical protein n=1 Tax=Methylococcus sp. EFPC2 TaxID=2812648 RepID=UPI00196703C6|nr:hypothetical protein [Methylococcus sp. EFPC2]QSA97299.1 hypothetical protein JWZ97_00140 [Methylococcus sp. EFPC2]
MTLAQPMVLRALWSLALGDYSGTLAGEAAAQLTELKFSRDAEAQVDLEGLRRLDAAGISPAGMPSFFAKLAEKEGAARLPRPCSPPIPLRRPPRAPASRTGGPAQEGLPAAAFSKVGWDHRRESQHAGPSAGSRLLIPAYILVGWVRRQP